MLKRILFITFHLGKGGAEKIFSELISNLDSEFEIYVITVKSGGVYESVVKGRNIVSYGTLEEAGGSFIKRILLLRRQIKKINPDKIISFLYYPNIITWLATIKLYIPIILSERDNPRIYLRIGIKNRILGLLLKKAYRSADIVIPVSKKVGQFVCEDFNLSQEKVIPIQNAINFEILDSLMNEEVSDFYFSKNQIYLIAVGRLEKAKNYDYLIETFTILKERIKNVQLIILGEGKEMNRIKEKVSNLKLSEYIHFLGFKKNPHKYVKRADVFVLSSDREGFPNSLLEAFYVNGHVVSTNCNTGPDEIITHNVDGFLAPLNDHANFSELIFRMATDNEVRAKMYANSRNKIKNFEQAKMIEMYRQILSEE